LSDTVVEEQPAVGPDEDGEHRDYERGQEEGPEDPAEGVGGSFGNDSCPELQPEERIRFFVLGTGSVGGGEHADRP